MRGKRTTALFAAIVAIGLAACGGEGDGEGSDGAEAPAALEGEAAAAALAQAAEATTATEETVDASFDLAVTGTATDDTELGFDARVDPIDQVGEFEIDAAGGAFTIRLGEDAAYISSDEASFTDALPEGAEWIEVSPDELASLGLDTSFDQGGLTPQLYLALGATDPVAGDTTEVNGVPVQTYSFGIDQEQAVAEAPEEAKAAVESAISLEGENQSIEGEAAIDGDGLLRQMSVTGVAETPDFGGEGIRVEVTFDVEYLDFGIEIETEPPDPETVVPLAEAPDAAAALGTALSG